MKILYCIAGTYRPGGMERVLANKANYLAQHGYEVTIVTTEQKGRDAFFALDPHIRCIDLAIGYEDNNGQSLFNKLIHYPRKQVLHKKRIKRVLREVKPDVTVSMFCNEVSFLASMKDGGLKVLEIHFSKFKRLQYGRAGLWHLVDAWRSRQDERIVRRYDRFVVLTEEDASYWGALPNICVIPNARTFNPSTVASLTSKNALAVGRFTYQKGFDRLLEAWKEVHASCPDWKLDIVGDGELKEVMQRYVADNGLADIVTLVPPAERMDEVYKSASMVVLSSHYEGLPMILLEAQAYGLPIVSFACKCGPKDVVTDGVDGFLIPEGDVPALADRIVQLAQDDALRQKMGLAARLASERYEEERVMAKWMRLFNENGRTQINETEYKV